MHGDYVMHLDNQYHPRIFISHSEHEINQLIPVQFYQANAHEAYF